MTTVPAIAPLTDIGTWARSNGLKIVLLVLVLGAVLLVRFVGWARDWFARRTESSEDVDPLERLEARKHRRALAQILTWVCTVLIWTVTAALVLTRFGIPFASLVAPLAAGGVALGLGGQRLVQDLIGGSFIIAERQYGIGDLVRVASTTETDGVTGTIEDLTLRITRLRTADGELVIVPNGQVIQVTNFSREWGRAVVDVPVPIGVDVERANDLLRQVGATAYEDEELKRLLLDVPTVVGAESLEVDQVNLQMVALTLPGKQFDVARRLRVHVTEAFGREGILASAEAPTVPTRGEG